MFAERPLGAIKAAIKTSYYTPTPPFPLLQRPEGVTELTGGEVETTADNAGGLML